MAETFDAGEIAVLLGDVLAGEAKHSVHIQGWEFTGLDMGEINVTTAGGDRFRLTVEAVNEDEADG